MYENPTWKSLIWYEVKKKKKKEKTRGVSGTVVVLKEWNSFQMHTRILSINEPHRQKLPI